MARDMKNGQGLPTGELWGYASGESVNSIAINGISNYALLFYTQVMGLDPEKAALALGIATLWDLERSFKI